MRNPKPAWRLFYALLGIAFALLLVADLSSPSDGWRAFAEGVVSLALVGVIALWVRANRLALALLKEGGEAKGLIRRWLACHSPRSTRRRRRTREPESNRGLAA